MEIISTIGLITINETLIIQLISFLIFLFVINRVMFRPLRTVMSERDNYIQKLKIEIDGTEDELKTVFEQIKEQESAVKKEAGSLKEKLEAAGSLKAGEIFDAAREEIEEMKTTAEKEVDAMISEARKSIQNESEPLATRIMEKLLDRRLAV
jgi:F-type H+-transporting ATPase subunit b